jgi:outer membrane protein assembly factor BamB
MLLLLGGVVGTVLVVFLCLCIWWGVVVARPPRGKPRLLSSRHSALSDPASVDPLWPCRSGDVRRSGFASRSGPRDLRSPAWTFLIDEVCYATPVVDGSGRTLIATTAGTLLCLSPDGVECWRYVARACYLHCPAIDGSIVFVADCEGNVYALDVATGRERWLAHTGTPTHADAAALTVGFGTVLVCCNGDPKKRIFGSLPEHDLKRGTVIALDAASGNVTWSADVGPLFNAAPAFAEAGRAVIVTDSDGGVHKLDTSTGATEWQVTGYAWAYAPHERWPGASGALTMRSFSGAALVTSVEALAGDELVCVTGNCSALNGVARAHSVSDGAILWQSDPLPQHVGCGAALAVLAGVPTLVLPVGYTAPQHMLLKHVTRPYKGSVHALHAECGAPLWTCDVSPMDRMMPAGQVRSSAAPPLCLRSKVPMPCTACATPPTVSNRLPPSATVKFRLPPSAAVCSPNERSSSLGARRASTSPTPSAAQPSARTAPSTSAGRAASSMPSTGEAARCCRVLKRARARKPLPPLDKAVLSWLSWAGGPFVFAQSEREPVRLKRSTKDGPLKSCRCGVTRVWGLAAIASPCR